MKWLLAAGLYLLLVSPAAAVLMTLEQPRISAGGQLKMLVETRTSRVTAPELDWPVRWEEHLQLLEKEHRVEPLPRGYYQHRWLLTWKHQDAQSRSQELNLPPLRVGGRPAQRLQLQITAAPQPAAPSVRRLTQPLEIDHQIERKEVYLGESLLYQLTIRYQGYPREPRLSPLEVQGGYSRSLGEGREEGFNQRGVHWQEARWREIVQINQLEAQIQPRYFSSRLDRSGQAGGERHEAEAPAIELKVLPLPDAWPEAAAWLPALGIRLEAEWQGATTGRIQGEPIELEINLMAVGQQARSLPRFQPESLPGVRIEPLAEYQRDAVTEGYLTGHLTQRLLVYPLDAGSLLLPPLKVHWWDIDNRRLQTSRVNLPPLRIEPHSFRSEIQKEPASQQQKATPPPDWTRIIVQLLVLSLLVAVAYITWRIYLLQSSQQLKKHIQQGPETWSHSELLALVREFDLQDQAQPLLTEAATGKPLRKKQLLAFWFPGKTTQQPDDLPPINP